MDAIQKVERPAWLNQDNSVDLLVPVSYHVGDEPHRLDRVQLRRLTAAECLIMDDALRVTEKVLRILEAMTDQPRAVTIKFDAVDIDRIDLVFGYFMQPGSVTGAIT